MVEVEAKSKLANGLRAQFQHIEVNIESIALLIQLIENFVC